MKPAFESVEYDADYSIKCFQYRCDAFQENHDWHFHSEYEVALIVKGEGTRLVGDGVEPFGVGDLVFLGPNLPHCWVSKKEPQDNKQKSEMLVIQFRPEVLPDSLLSLPELARVQTLLSDSRRGVAFNLSDTGDNADIQPCLLKIQNTQGVERYATLLRLLEKISQLDCTRQLVSEAYSGEFENDHSDRIAKVMSYIRDNIAGDIKQTDAAELLNMTPQSFSRFFKASTGRTFVSFVNFVRISQACRLLMHSDKDITEIAFACGYSSLPHFNRQFSEIKKVTPSQFREMS